MTVHLKTNEPKTACGLTVQTHLRSDAQVPERGWVGPWRSSEVNCPKCLAVMASDA